MENSGHSTVGDIPPRRWWVLENGKSEMKVHFLRSLLNRVIM